MRRRRGAAVVALVLMLSGVTGCLQPQLAACGEDWCLEGTTCIAGRCATTAQTEACTGIADGGTCTFGGAVGTCEGTVCVAKACGNGVTELAEACDDGNATSGDGCRGDCQKIEMCGDAVIDDNEDCDDGNINAADGCDACVPTTWGATAVIGGSSNATTTGLDYSAGIAVDRRGNIYIAEYNAHRIRRVDTNGVVTVVAGTGTAGFSGDGGAATSADLTYPYGVAVDGLGTIYIADTLNSRIRRVDSTGVITTVAGTGVEGSSGDSGAATSARLLQPRGLAVDGLGTLYIADTDNHRIRRVDTAGIITTVAGTGAPGYGGDGGAATSAQLWNPWSVALDGLGNLYITDKANSRIRRVDPNGVITTVAGNGTLGNTGDGGAATSARLYYPAGVAVDGLGNMYIADCDNNRIRRVDTTGIITRVAGTGIEGFSGDGGPATSAQLFRPVGVAAGPLGDVYFADNENYRVRRVDATGVITTVAGSGDPGSSGDGGAATTALLQGPYGVAVDALGNSYIADTSKNRIRRVDTTGVITTVAGTGALGLSGDGGAATSARLSSPEAVALDGAGNLYIADTNNHCIRRVDTTGIITRVAGTGAPGSGGDGGAATIAGLNSPSGVAVDGLGNLYISDFNNQSIRRVNTAGIITTIAGTGTPAFGGDGGPATSAFISYPRGIALDGPGNLYIADASNNRIRRVSTTGVITTVAGTGGSGFAGDGGAATLALLGYPSAVAVDSLGNVYIADRVNNRIRRVTSTGIITTVVGTGPPASGGDAGAATLADVYIPSGIAVDSLDNLYIADTGSNRIRRVSSGGVITTVAGLVDPGSMGPLAQARLADPRALVLTASFTFVAGGSSGTVQAARVSPAWLEVVAGRYPQSASVGSLARFRNLGFGTVSGVAFDTASGLLYLTESSSNRLHVVTIVDPANENTWTIAPFANTTGTEGFADGAAATAQFRGPTGLYLDAATHQLYVADTGNHVVRAIDLTSNLVRTVAGIPATRGLFGDGGAATDALLYAPQAITRCTTGDLFIADTGNHRVRRVVAGTNVISTVLGVGVAASSGEGLPASTFPVNAPLGLACDAIGNLFVTSTTTVRLLAANASMRVDGTGSVQTIYGASPRDSFPSSVTTCLTGLGIVDATKIQIVDSCTGLLVELAREPAPTP